MSDGKTAGMTLGLELEMVTAHRTTGTSHAVQRYFYRMAELKAARGEAVEVSSLAGHAVKLTGPAGESGLDNGFNLLETAFAPVRGGSGGLARLSDAVRTELNDVKRALAEEDAVVLNVSEHPACDLGADWYSRTYVPRPIYRELVGYRGWHHRVGIDAKAQNGPCTGVPVCQAARALNVMLALAPAFIALYANSPLEGGHVTGLRENRMTLWDRMFRNSRFPGDHHLQVLPERPFDDLGDYFRWMFAPGTASRALPHLPDEEYKAATSVYLRDDPPLSTFLRSKQWEATRDGIEIPLVLRPHSSHFVYSQFANFLDARWRYRLARLPDLDELLAAWERPHGIEAMFALCGVDGYIEGRAPGAVVGDAQLAHDAGVSIADSAVISPSALQLGLLRNLSAAEDLIRQWTWLRLRSLRAASMSAALAHDEVFALCRDVIDVARRGLDTEEQQWLDYPAYNLATRTTGADRLMRIWNIHESDAANLQRVVRQRALAAH